MREHAPPMLDVNGLVTGYGTRQVVDDVSFSVRASHIATLIGHNGAGKSTILRAVFGLLPAWSGVVRVDGVTATTWSVARLVREGVAYVPQGNNIFGGMSVYENLSIGLAAAEGKAHVEERVAEVIDLFPVLSSRMTAKAQYLSGGQKQMLAIGRALMTGHKLLLLDEPSAGLAPRAVSELFSMLREIASDRDLTVLVVEQRVREVLKFADVCGVLRRGRLTYWGESSNLSDESLLREVYL